MILCNIGQSVLGRLVVMGRSTGNRLGSRSTKLFPMLQIPATLSLQSIQHFLGQEKTRSLVETMRARASHVDVECCRKL